MKKFFSVFMLLSVAVLFFSCQKAERQILPVDEKPVFSISLSFEKGNFSPITKNNESVFSEFYEKMNSGEMVALDYDLTFTNVNTGAVHKIKGKWNDDKMYTLRTGTYHIVGVSTAEGDFIQEKCSIVIDEEMDITASTSVIVLHPHYDCSLLVFTHPDITELTTTINGVAYNFFTFNGYRYVFVRSSMSGGDADAYISGRYSDETTFKIYTDKLSFVKGCYYIHNATINTFTLPGMQDGMSADTLNHTPCVDLGLSVKWAPYNVGSTTEEDLGVRYGWGEIVGKDHYDWDNYKWCDGNYNNMNKYCSNSSYGIVDGKNVLDLADDIAFLTYGDGWRMPTKAELEDLMNCTWSSETVNGVNGYRVVGPNGNSLFFPGNGQWDENGLNVLDWVNIWSNECDDTYWGCKLEVNNASSRSVGYNSHKHDGLCVRGVYTK